MKQIPYNDPFLHEDITNVFFCYCYWPIFPILPCSPDRPLVPSLPHSPLLPFCPETPEISKSITRLYIVNLQQDCWHIYQQGADSQGKGMSIDNGVRMIRPSSWNLTLFWSKILVKYTICRTTFAHINDTYYMPYLWPLISNILFHG